MRAGMFLLWPAVKFTVADWWGGVLEENAGNGDNLGPGHNNCLKGSFILKEAGNCAGMQGRFPIRDLPYCSSGFLEIV